MEASHIGRLGEPSIEGDPGSRKTRTRFGCPVSPCATEGLPGKVMLHKARPLGGQGHLAPEPELTDDDEMNAI